MCCQRARIVGSQNGLGRKRPESSSSSNPLPWAGTPSTSPGCSQPRSALTKEQTLHQTPGASALWSRSVVPACCVRLSSGARPAAADGGSASGLLSPWEAWVQPGAGQPRDESWQDLSSFRAAPAQGCQGAVKINFLGVSRDKKKLHFPRKKGKCIILCPNLNILTATQYLCPLQ